MIFKIILLFVLTKPCNKWQCDNKKICIEFHKVCDDFTDCIDHSDENKCHTTLTTQTNTLTTNTLITNTITPNTLTTNTLTTNTPKNNHFISKDKKIETNYILIIVIINLVLIIIFIKKKSNQVDIREGNNYLDHEYNEIYTEPEYLEPTPIIRNNMETEINNELRNNNEIELNYDVIDNIV